MTDVVGRLASDLSLAVIHPARGADAQRKALLVAADPMSALVDESA